MTEPRSTLIPPATVRLERLLNGVQPRPFWASHDRLVKEYEAAI